MEYVWRRAQANASSMTLKEHFDEEPADRDDQVHNNNGTTKDRRVE
jgi:hypothetical protein